MTAPNPTGCYLKVFDQPQLRGTADFLNGPVRYATLTGLPNGANWNDRIRSIEVGPGATATAWADVNYARASMELRLDTRYSVLPSALVGAIKSLDVRCTQAPAPALRNHLGVNDNGRSARYVERGPYRGLRV